MHASQRPHPSRSVRRLFLLLFTALLLTTSQISGGFAQNASQAMAGSYFQAIQAGGAFAPLSAQAILHTPEGDFLGANGPASFGAVLGSSFTDLQFATKSVETVDGLVIINFTLMGINSGSYHGVAANCAGVAVSGVAVLQIGDEGVKRQWIGYDSDALESQIASFNEFDPNTRPGCSDHLSSLPELTPVDNVAAECMQVGGCGRQLPAKISPALEPAPQCWNAKECSLPY